MIEFDEFESWLQKHIGILPNSKITLKKNKNITVDTGTTTSELGQLFKVFDKVKTQFFFVVYYINLILYSFLSYSPGFRWYNFGVRSTRHDEGPRTNSLRGRHRSNDESGRPR